MNHQENFYSGIEEELEEISKLGLKKNERLIQSAQSNKILVQNREVLNFCANNYLGLANNKELCNSAKAAIDKFGLGLASVRFICGTQEIHRELENKLTTFLGMEDCILYPSCFDANGGLFETILSEQDAVISDSLNHASIIDGIRLSKAKRFRYEHSNMEDLERALKEANQANSRRLLVTSDGAFSMDGEIAKLPEIVNLAQRYGALVHIDECHATGVLGNTGRGTCEHFGIKSGVHIITSTLGKALGGSAGGFTVAKKSIIDLLRQRSRPYLFSNTLAPAIVGAAISCIELLSKDTSRLQQLHKNTLYFRSKIKELGFTIKGDTHPIVPVMLGDAKLASQMADELLQENIYVIGFSFPVVPKGEARIRVQLSAAHTPSDLDQALTAFEKVGRRHGIIS